MTSTCFLLCSLSWWSCTTLTDFTPVQHILPVFKKTFMIKSETFRHIFFISNYTDDNHLICEVQPKLGVLNYLYLFDIFTRFTPCLSTRFWVLNMYGQMQNFSHIFLRNFQWQSLEFWCAASARGPILADFTPVQHLSSAYQLLLVF